MELGFAHRALEPEQKAVVEVRRVVDAILIEDERVGERADLEQAVPVGGVARKARDLETHHDARPAHAHLRHESLEAFAIGGRPRLPLVAVDDDDPFEWPSERDGALAQGVLTLGALLVLEDLTQRRLPDVEVRVALEVTRLDFGMRFAVHDHTSVVLVSAIAAKTSTTSRCTFGGITVAVPAAVGVRLGAKEVASVHA